MKKLFQRALAGLLLLTSAAMGIELSDLSPELTRTSADENLTKNYAYRVLSDLSVRRIWNLDSNRKLSIDFDAKKGNLICIIVDYRKPVTLEEADKDAADIGKFEEAKWKKFPTEKAAKYFMGRSRAMKFKQGYMFQELTGANKCMRLTFYTDVPKENRRLISEGEVTSTKSAMGSSGGSSAVQTLLDDEEKRLYTPNKTDKPKTVAKPKKKPEIIEDEEPEPEVEEFQDEEPAEVEPEEPEKVVQEPVKTAPTIKKKKEKPGMIQELLAKLGLDKLTTLHWILIGVGLVILITIISAIGRSNERRRIETRAARLRNTGSVKDSLRAGLQVKKGKPRLK